MATRIGFGRRFGAALLDMIALIILSIFVGPLVGGIFGGAAGGTMGALAGDPAAGAAAGGVLGAVMGAMAGMVIVSLLYWLLEVFSAASPGKMILGIKIRNADSSPASTNTLATRYAVKNVVTVAGLLTLLTGIQMIATLGNILGFIVFIGLFFVFGANRQALHDMIAKTAVYKTAELGA